MHLSQLIAWHNFLDYLCITMLPLPSFCAVKFSLLTCYSLAEDTRNKLVYIGSQKQLLICFVFMVLAFGFDLIKLCMGFGQQRTRTGLGILFGMSMVNIYNTMIVYIS
jgi:hypothetical protein